MLSRTPLPRRYERVARADLKIVHGRSTRAHRPQPPPAPPRPGGHATPGSPVASSRRSSIMTTRCQMEEIRSLRGSLGMDVGRTPPARRAQRQSSNTSPRFCTLLAQRIALFVGLLAATRFVQRWLAAGALAQGRMDPGLANSIYTGAGYIGFAVAALAAIAYAGFDITSLAIVAGALVGRHRLRPAVDRQQLRLRADPAGRAADQGRRLDLHQGGRGLRAEHRRALDRDRDVRPRQPHRAELRAHHADGRQPHAPQSAWPSQGEGARLLSGRSRTRPEGAAAGGGGEHVHPAPSRHPSSCSTTSAIRRSNSACASISPTSTARWQAQTELRIAIFKALHGEGIDMPYGASLAGHATTTPPQFTARQQ